MPDAAEIVRPRLAWFLLLDGGVATLTALATSQERRDRAAEIVPLPSRSALKLLLGATVAVHVGEAVYAHRLARRHGLPAVRWARQTFVVGFPSTLALRRTIAAR